MASSMAPTSIPTFRSAEGIKGGYLTVASARLLVENQLPYLARLVSRSQLPSRALLVVFARRLPIINASRHA